MTKITWDAIKDTAISLKIDSKLIKLVYWMPYY